MSRTKGYTDYRYGWRHGWRWIGWFVRHRRFVAGLRQAYLTYVRGYVSETCERCGRSYPLWHAADEVFNTVTGRVGRDGECAPGLFCIACFDALAERGGITLQWAPSFFPSLPTPKTEEPEPAELGKVIP